MTTSTPHILFSELNYTFGNEDTALEYALLPLHATHVACVAGSGSRVIPLLAKFPKRVTCVDVSPAQLYVTELRVEIVRTLSCDDYRAFWGYGTFAMNATERERVFSTLTLGADARAYLLRLFVQNKWESILYAGRWERAFKRLSRCVRVLVGPATHELFESTTHVAHERYLREQFPHGRWRIAIALLSSSAIFNALLYRGHFPSYNARVPRTQFYREAFARLFAQGPARSNALLQILLLGTQQYDEGLPVDCDPTVFGAAQSALRTTSVSYVCGSVPQAIAELDSNVDFVSFSDVPSYFSAPDERTFMQQIRQVLSPEALVVNRYYLHTPVDVDVRGYRDVTTEYHASIAAERVQMYSIKVYARV